MSWLKKYLNYAGLVLVVLSLILLIVWPQHQKTALILAWLAWCFLFFILSLTCQDLSRASSAVLSFIPAICS